MRLIVLTYRLKKIKGVLVSVGICALTNATLFVGSSLGALGLSLSFANLAQAGPCSGDSGTLSGV
jgi:hypothetical protein